MKMKWNLSEEARKVNKLKNDMYYIFGENVVCVILVSLCVSYLLLTAIFIID